MTWTSVVIRRARGQRIDWVGKRGRAGERRISRQEAGLEKRLSASEDKANQTPTRPGTTYKSIRVDTPEAAATAAASVNNAPTRHGHG